MQVGKLIKLLKEANPEDEIAFSIGIESGMSYISAVGELSDVGLEEEFELGDGETSRRLVISISGTELEWE